MRSTMRGVLVSVVAYGAGYVATLMIFIAVNGIDTHPDGLLPFYAVFGLLLGGLVCRWWLLPLPALHLGVIDSWPETYENYGSTRY